MADVPAERAGARTPAGDGSRSSFVALALAIVAAELALYAAHHALFARIEGTTIAGRSFPDYFTWFPELVFAVGIAYAALVPRYSRRAALRDLDDLRPALDCSEPEFARLRATLASAGGRNLRLAAVVGALFGVALTFHPGIWAQAAVPELRNPELSWGLLRNPVVFMLFARVIVLEVELARCFSRFGRERARIDLLDLQPLMPLARRGLKTVLVFFVGAAIASLTALGPWQQDALLLLLIVIVGGGVTAMILPVRGAHRRIRDAKQSELAPLRAAIRAERGRLLSAHGAGRATDARLADLLAWEARVEGVREWPFDAPTLLRFALYLAIPLGSWLGGALVERLLGVLLD